VYQQVQDQAYHFEEPPPYQYQFDVYQQHQYEDHHEQPHIEEPQQHDGGGHAQGVPIGMSMGLMGTDSIIPVPAPLDKYDTRVHPYPRGYPLCGYPRVLRYP